MDKSLSWTMLLSYAEPFICLSALLAMNARRQLGVYRFLALFLGTRILTDAILISLILDAPNHISKGVAYQIYFYSYWCSYFIEAGLGLGIIHELYQLAMAPLRGLQSLGTMMFKWALAIAAAVALAMTLSPHGPGGSLVTRVIAQVQQTQSVLTLCLLLFVCFAIRPMGLSFRSKIFGVSFGLGVLATCELVISAWFPRAPALQSSLNTAHAVIFCSTVLMWTAYFAFPEPKRRLIVLPTTSPFLRWNQISIALGDPPGFVAIAGINPDSLTPAEVEIMRRASLKMDPATIYS